MRHPPLKNVIRYQAFYFVHDGGACGTFKHVTQLRYGGPVVHLNT